MKRIDDVFASFDQLWSPRIVARVDDHHLKVARIEGEYVWHAHADADELFWVLEGQLTLRFEDREVVLGPGDVHVVPAGVRHQPVAAPGTRIALVEKVGTANTGDAGGPGTSTGIDG